MNTAKNSNVKSIIVIVLVSVMLFGVFYYLITDVTNTPSSDLKAQSQVASEQVAQNYSSEATKTDEKLPEVAKEEIKEETEDESTEVKGTATEVSVFKALSTQKTTAQPKEVLGGMDSQTSESTVPATGSETIFGAFVLSSLIMFSGIYLFMTQQKSTALAKFEQRITRELD